MWATLQEFNDNIFALDFDLWVPISNAHDGFNEFVRLVEMLEQLGQDYIRAARARGLPPRHPEHRFGVLFADEASVFVARAALPPTERPYASVTRSACTRWHLDHPGGVPSTEREGAPSPYQARVWEIHRRLWPHEDGLPYPELERMVSDLFPGFRWPRSALCSMLRRERAFGIHGRPVTRSVVVATGNDVPEDCRPVTARSTPTVEGDPHADPEP